MGVRHDGRLAEYVPHDQIRTLAAHAGQGKQRVEIIRHMAVVPVAQHPHTGRNIPCLAVAQPAGLDDGLNIRRIRCSQFFYAGVLGKQLLHHHVYAGIGALGRQPYRHKQLPRMVIIQRAVGIGIFCLQARNADRSQLLFGHSIFSVSILFS